MVTMFLRVNPLSIGTPISTQELTRLSMEISKCVNPLSIGTPISTWEALTRYVTWCFVSIPYLSGHPFLHDSNCWWTTYDTVSIPYLSGHPFLQTDAFRQVLLRQKSVNPLSIGTPIATNMKTINDLKKSLCQSPIYRDTHFYREGMTALLIVLLLVSIPYLSGHPFLRPSWNVRK